MDSAQPPGNEVPDGAKHDPGAALQPQLNDAPIAPLENSLLAWPSIAMGYDGYQWLGPDRLTTDSLGDELNDGFHFDDVLLTGPTLPPGWKLLYAHRGVAGRSKAKLAKRGEHDALTAALEDLILGARRLDRVTQMRGPDDRLAIIGVRRWLTTGVMPWLKGRVLSVRLEGTAAIVRPTAEIDNADDTEVISTLAPDAVQYVLPAYVWRRNVGLRDIDAFADAALVRCLAHEDAVHEAYGVRYDEDEQVRRLLAESTPARSNYLIAINDIEVGFAHLSFEADPVDPAVLVVYPCLCVSVPEARGRGLGTLALGALTDVGADRAQIARVIVDASDQHIKNMCIANGYEGSSMEDGRISFEKVLLLS